MCIAFLYSLVMSVVSLEEFRTMPRGWSLDSRSFCSRVYIDYYPTLIMFSRAKANTILELIFKNKRFNHAILLILNRSPA